MSAAPPKAGFFARRPPWRAAAGIAAVALLAAADGPLSQAATMLVPPAAEGFVSAFTDGGLFVFYALFAALFLRARATGNRRLSALFRVYLKAQLGCSFLLVRVLKIAVGRARPGEGGGFDFFALDAGFNSFPSGHAADVFTGAVLLHALMAASALRRWRHLPLVYAALVAASRVVVGAHYPSDVLAGALLGVLGARWFAAREPGLAAGPPPAR